MGGLFDRFRRGEIEAAHEAAAPDETVVTIDATSLSRVFSAPMWLRDLGLLAWFLVGVGLVLFGLIWLLGLTSTIVDPVIVGRHPRNGRRPSSSPQCKCTACRELRAPSSCCSGSSP